MLYIFAILIGAVAGLRAMTPLAAISWAAYLGWIDFVGTPVSFIGHIVTVIVLTLLAIGELVTDQLPQTPSRKVPMQFGARIVLGAIAGALLPGNSIIGLILGAIGAVIGTLGGAELRSRLAKSFGQDRPAALIEDAIAVRRSSPRTIPILPLVRADLSFKPGVEPCRPDCLPPPLSP